MEYEIEITDFSPLDVFKIFGDGKSLESGSVIDLGEGVKLRYNGMIERRALGAESVIELVLEISTAIGAGLAASYIYDKLKRGNSRMTIERKEIEFEEGKIKKILLEKFEKEK